MSTFRSHQIYEIENVQRSVVSHLVRPLKTSKQDFLDAEAYPVQFIWGGKVIGEIYNTDIRSNV